jgi:hypothetical protein
MPTWFAVAAIVVGLAGCFYGYPLFRVFLILAGSIYGYLFGQSLVPVDRPWIALAVSLGAAAVMAVLAYPLWSISVIAIGGTLGFAVLNAFGIVLNVSPRTSSVLGILGAVAGGFLLYGARDLFVMLATSFVGAVLAVHGLGLTFPTLAFGSGRSNSSALLAIVVLGCLGFAAQYGMFKDLRTYSG